jgi:hypothetical protein
MTAQTTADGFAPYREELADLRERVRNPESSADRLEAVRRMAEIDREVHADTYERLRHK